MWTFTYKPTRILSLLSLWFRLAISRKARGESSACFPQSLQILEFSTSLPPHFSLAPKAPCKVRSPISASLCPLWGTQGPSHSHDPSHILHEQHGDPQEILGSYCSSCSEARGSPTRDSLIPVFSQSPTQTELVSCLRAQHRGRTTSPSFSLCFLLHFFTRWFWADVSVCADVLT